jgi:hypothetical protein
MSRTPPRITRAVYDGRDRLGSVKQRGDEFIARDNRNQLIGPFESAIEASRAVSSGNDQATRNPNFVANPRNSLAQPREQPQRAATAAHAERSNRNEL